MSRRRDPHRAVTTNVVRGAAHGRASVHFGAAAQRQDLVAPHDHILLTPLRAAACPAISKYIVEVRRRHFNAHLISVGQTNVVQNIDVFALFCRY